MFIHIVQQLYKGLGQGWKYYNRILSYQSLGHILMVI